MKYIEFIETNDYEGETWHFFLPVEGNEESLKTLEYKLKVNDIDEYSIDWTPRTESYVRGLVQRKGSTKYMKEFNLVSGKLSVPEFENASDLDALLFKGGIQSFFS